MVKKLESILTDDMEHCFYTGSPIVERHHVFGGFNRTRSENYKFVVPLHPTIHPNGAMAGKLWKEYDIDLKRRCQKYYEEHHGSREDFIKEFGRSFINEEDSEHQADGDSGDGEIWVQCDTF